MADLSVSTLEYLYQETLKKRTFNTGLHYRNITSYGMVIECERTKDAIFRPSRDVRERRNLFVSLYMHRIASSDEKIFQPVPFKAGRFRASSVFLVIFRRRRRSAAYLIKVHSRRHAYNRINRF